MTVINECVSCYKWLSSHFVFNNLTNVFFAIYSYFCFNGRKITILHRGATTRMEGQELESQPAGRDCKVWCPVDPLQSNHVEPVKFVGKCATLGNNW